MNEKILEAFSELGFVLENVEVGYHFSYEGTNMMLLNTEEDESFLSVAVPCVAELDEDNPILLCALMQKINSSMKYVKACMCEDCLWLFYERELFEGENLQESLPNIINRLHYSRIFALQSLEGLTNMSNDDNETQENDITETNTKEE